MSNQNPLDRENKRFADNVISRPFDELVKDSTSSVTVDKKNSTASKIWWSAIIVLLIVALSYVFFLLSTSDSNYTSANETEFETVVEQSGDEVSVTVFDPLANPINSFTFDLPPASSGTLTATVKGNVLEIENGSKLVLGEPLVISPSVNPCSVTNKSDFCFIGTGKIDGSTLEFFLIKDVTDNRLFEGATNLQEVSVKGTPLSAIISLGNDTDSLQILLIVNSDSSGFMVRYPNDLPIEKITELLEVK